MRIPDRYLRLEEAHRLFSSGWDAEGCPDIWPRVFSWSYPPPGFLPIELFALGNGDQHGLYWPIGREDREPILCETYHDEWHVEPHASTLEGLVAKKWLEAWYDRDQVEYEEGSSIAQQLNFDLPEATRGNSPPPQEILRYDPASPGALLAAAVNSVETQQLAEAEEYLVRALDALPEYTAGLVALAEIYRRTNRSGMAASKMLEALSSPSCFGNGRAKCLAWLQRLRDSDFPELAVDPLWRYRRDLTFETGVKTNTDFEIYEAAIQEYLQIGKGVVAVRLRILVGELMSRETTSFRDRYDYSREKHIQLLAENLEKARLSSRLVTLTRVD